MRKKLIILGIMTLMCVMFFASPAMATVTPTNPVPLDNATGVDLYLDAFNVTLTSNDTSSMTGTIYCVQTEETRTLTAVTNGSYMLNFSADYLWASTTYQIWVNISDDTWTNTSYNFTTAGASRMRQTEEVPTWAPGLIITITLLVFLVLLFNDVNSAVKNKSFDKNAIQRMLMYFVAIIFLGIALSII